MTDIAKQSSRTRIMVECAMLLAVASVLSFWPKIPIFAAVGGSITLCSMLPIVLISYRRGLKWGFLSSFAFALIQMLNFKSAGGMGVWSTIGIILLDYIIAFGVLGIGGIFRGKFKHRGNELALGAALALFLRYLSHTLSGFIFFGEYAEWFFGETGAFGQTVLAKFSGNMLYFIYSAIYNAVYMVPEIILTVIVCYLLSMKKDLIVPKTA